ncbi:MAG TPA: tetratricopeptide repeat protein [Bryobacteraceae bacterium]|nr:tetratricopeptide repeat protein [Bryobacteraceae bacterium]
MKSCSYRSFTVAARLAAGRLCAVAVLGGFALTPVFAQSAPVKACEALRHHGDPGTAECYKKLTASTDLAVRAEGFWYARDYQNANNAFRDAVKARPKDSNILTRWAYMYMEHWQPKDAQEMFGEALELDENNAQALLGLATLAGEQYENKAYELAEKALKADPKLYQARELIAKVALEDNDSKKAAEEAHKALEMSPEAMDAMAILATMDWLENKPNTEWFERILKINPTYGQAYETAGHFFWMNRRYIEAIQYYRKALELKPDLWSARGAMGTTMMQLGQEAEARQQLEQCWANNYQTTEIKNSLTLMDSYKNFQTIKTPGGNVLRLDKKEAALLQPYFATELDRAIQTYAGKYKYKLTGPVQVEVYPNHEDFSVRTAGLPGMGGILGVTFVQSVAMDSPSGRKPGDFHWASTMWHELSHVYVLAMTNHLAPRWFAEGVAVYEETAVAPDWGDRLDHESLNAIKEHKLLPIAELDRGYIHPSYPSQVVVSYFQGGRVITFIVEKWGYNKILDMIADYAKNMSTPDVIQKEFQLKPEEFDKLFFPWLEAQTKKTLDGLDAWTKGVRAMNDRAKAKDWDSVISTGVPIRDIYPDYVETGSVYEFLAQAYTEKGDKAKAMAELEAYAKVGGRSPATLKQLANLQADAGRKKEAVATLDKLNLIYLDDEAAHQKQGELYLDLGDSAKAVREFQSILARKAIDPAGAHYQLARALQMAKRNDEAKDEVYAALETAPNYKPAQKLLLELNSK